MAPWQGVDMFGKRIGFLNFKADIFYKETGKKVPGIVFARGPAVAVLILLDSGGETCANLTEQVRVPTGRVVLELPAGMLDDDKGDFVGTAVREVEEEIGIHLNLEDMIDLTAFLDPSTGHSFSFSDLGNKLPLLRLITEAAFDLMTVGIAPSLATNLRPLKDCSRFSNLRREGRSYTLPRRNQELPQMIPNHKTQPNKLVRTAHYSICVEFHQANSRWFPPRNTRGHMLSNSLRIRGILKI
ncbi:hypothetical protein ACOSP7_025654 [Xanthoceras sorbifolium]